mmetsp:Transcript_40422/g.86064  ORF Transcript_40422/g.86064 Transcript_40422/m.86064 type:complete len:114 (-) Transcript_40422:202-543(-)
MHRDGTQGLTDALPHFFQWPPHGYLAERTHAREQRRCMHVAMFSQRASIRLIPDPELGSPWMMSTVVPTREQKEARVLLFTLASGTKQREEIAFQSGGCSRRRGWGRGFVKEQ